MDNDKIPGRTSAEQNIKPKFEGGTSEGGDAPGGKDHVLGTSEKSSDSKSSDPKSSDQSSAADTLSDAENSATDGFYKPEKSQSAEDSESSPRGFYSGKGIGEKSQGPLKSKGLFKGKLAKFTAVASIGAIAASSIFAIGFIGVPMFLIGTIDMNLQDSLGFTDTTAILEEQAEYITGEMASEGEFPASYAEDLADAGILVGQVTASGDFVRTNTYIANIDELTDIAVIGHYQTNATEPGQLSFLFDNQIIDAANFVATVESNPVMFAAYSKAANISARYYYSNDVQKVYDDAEISRNVFAEWQKTEDHETNMKTFNELKNKALDKQSLLAVTGCDTLSYSTNDENESTVLSGCNEPSKFSNGSGADPDDIIKEATEKTGNNGQKAAGLLNAAVSASEPYLAATAFVIVEEPIQRARIDGTGPVNELMDVLSEPNPVTYTDVNTGETVTTDVPILKTQNFTAAISRSAFSSDEAANFSRDRILTATYYDHDSDLISDTSITPHNKVGSDVTVTKDNDDVGTIGHAYSSLRIAVSSKNSDLFATAVGGNRIVEGGSFLSNIINSRVVGAMPSNEQTVQKYNQKVKVALARRAEADRATLSPFDISSPNTFLGSIAHSFANSVLRNSALSSSSISSSASIFGNVVKSSTDSLFSTAFADDSEDETKLTAQFGDCSTVQVAADVSGDLYCTSHNTIETGFMDKGKNYWSSMVDVDDSGNVTEGSGLSKFIALGMGRESTVGIDDAEICKRAKDDFNEGDGFFNFLRRVIANLFGTYTECIGVNEDIANGAAYTLSGRNNDHYSIKLYSAYVLYDTVESLLSGTQSKVSAYKESYYAKHPRDDSPAGRLARISGMTKEEATLALTYSSYLTYIANYNPTERYAFGVATITSPVRFTSPITTPNDSTPILALLSHTPIKNQI